MEETSQVIGSFLPVKLLGRIHGAGGDRPAAVEFPAAVLFIDVSRYTALVEQLARRGQDGLEKISGLLSHSYARCADQICDRGGEVLQIAGDALLACWPADIEGLESAVQRAVDCAAAICRDRGNRSEGVAGEIQPALHVGVGAGPLWAAALGGRPVWNLVAGGDAVVQAARSQALARRWQYVLSEQAKLALVNGGSQRERLRTRFDFCAISPAADWLVEFLPPQLREILLGANIDPGRDASTIADPAGDRRTAAKLDALAEVRPITVLFVRIVGLDDHGPQALARHQSLCAALQDDLRARGGPAGDLLFDDKGLIFIAIFGARGSFHRDNACRAVDTACAIQRTVRRLGLSASIGVASGDTLFRVVGSARRRQLMALGASMNRAARLMTAISADILCDAPTERASRTAFEFDECGTLQLDGLEDISAVFRPLEPRVTILGSSPLIGRENELRLLRQAFDETRGGGTRLVLVVGESGIGKTALVRAFSDDLSLTEVAVHLASAEREDRRTSLLPWRRVLASLLDLSSDIDGVVMLEAVTSRLQGNLAISGRVPLLGGVLGIEIPQSEETRHLDGAHRADATMRLLGDLIGVLARRPLVLVLEDSQWLDSASWRLIEWVLASLPSLLLILCVRSEEIPAELNSLRRRAEAIGKNATVLEADDSASFFRILELEELRETAIWELVARTLGEAPPHDELARGVSAFSGGNPFFAEELALTLKSEGLVVVRDGFWRPIRPLDRLKYFDGVERVIRERIDRLDSTAQVVLKAAAVIGRSFSQEALEILLEVELSGDAVRVAIDALLSAHLVRHLSGAGDYEFRHDQTRDLVYGSIPGDLRRRLHGNLANWIETAQAGEAGADITTLVQHFEAAGNKDKAVRYADLAATKAFQTGAFREVEAFLEICFRHEPLQQAKSFEQRLRALRWSRQLAEAHYSSGNIPAQSLAVGRALAAAGDSVPRSRIALVVRLLTRSLRLVFQQIIVPQVAQPEELRCWEQELSRCFSQAATVDYFELRFSLGMSHLIAAVSHAERTGLTAEMAVAPAQLACGLGILGYRRACYYFMDRAERVAVALADPAVYSQVCNLDAIWRIGHCDWTVVDRRLDQSQVLALSAGDQLTWCNAQAARFWSLYYRGDWAALDQTARALLSRAQSAGNIQQENWALRCRAQCLLHAGNVREAVSILRLFASTMDKPPADEAVASGGPLALALARLGMHAESVQAAVETLRVLRKIGAPTDHSTLIGISSVCEVLLRGREAGLSRNYELWPDWERQALNELSRYRNVYPVGLPQYGLWLGVSQWLNGQHGRAASSWKRALETARHLSLRRDESMIAAEMRRRLDQ